MKRRSFLALLGLAPGAAVVSVAKPAAEPEEPAEPDTIILKDGAVLADCRFDRLTKIHVEGQGAVITNCFFQSVPTDDDDNNIIDA